MRISDWSSDVCSSDLGRVAGAAVGARYVAGREGLDEGRVRPSAVGPGDIEEVADLAEHADAGVDQNVGRARKRVGEGKSVSVRVDLGGRSIINTTTIVKNRVDRDTSKK